MTVQERLFYLALAESSLPPRFIAGLNRYFAYGIPPGDFLRACLENNLHRAVTLADHDSLTLLPDLVRFLVNHLPVNAWGSRQAIKDWLESKDHEHAARFNAQADGMADDGQDVY